MTGFPSGCLGKLPLHGDFIRYNAASPEVQELDQWIGEGIVLGNNELDARWDATFDAAPAARFIHVSPRTHRAVAGLLRPSVDKAGRRYPFLIYAVVEPGALGSDLGYLPLALESFAASARSIAAQASGAASVNAFLAGFENLKLDRDMGEAKRAFSRYVLSRQATEFFGNAFGAANDPRMHAAIQTLSEGPDTRAPASVAMRLPLNEAAVEVSFWLELARRLTKAGTLPVLAYWSDAPGARLHLCFGEMASKYFLPFVLPTRTDASLRDLTAPKGDPAASQRGKATFDQVLSAPSLKLADMLQRLPRCKGL